MTVPRGIGQSRPLETIAAPAGPGCVVQVVEPELREECQRLRPAGQDRLGADVDADASDVLEPQLPTETVGALEYRDGTSVAEAAELPGCRQPTDATADDRDRPAHAVTLSSGSRAG